MHKLASKCPLENWNREKVVTEELADTPPSMIQLIRPGGKWQLAGGTCQRTNFCLIRYMADRPSSGLSAYCSHKFFICRIWSDFYHLAFVYLVVVVAFVNVSCPHDASLV